MSVCVSVCLCVCLSVSVCRDTVSTVAYGLFFFFFYVCGQKQMGPVFFSTAFRVLSIQSADFHTSLPGKNRLNWGMGIAQWLERRTRG